MFIPAVNTAKVVIVQRLHGQVIQNVHYVRNSTAWGTADLQDLANLYITWWNDNLADELSTDMTLTSVQARDMTTEESAGVEIQAPPGSGGNHQNGAMPGNVALTIKLVTGLTGRNRRGRTFIAGMGEDRVNGNAVTDNYRDEVLIDFGQLRTALVAAGYEHVVASFYNGTALVLQPNGETLRKPVPRATALLTPIEGYTADTNLDSQRRRLAGRGI